MNEKDTTLAIELLLNQVLHVRTQVQILQEKLDMLGVVSSDRVEKEVEEQWAQSGHKAVDAFWDEFHKIRKESE